MTVVMSRTLIRPFLLLVVVASIAGVSGCGSSDDGDDGGSSAQAAGNTGAGGGSPENAINDIRERYNAMDGEGYCARLTAAGRAEIERNARGSEWEFKTKKDCVGFANQVLHRLVPKGQRLPPNKVIDVTVKGDEARVKVAKGLAGQPDYPVTFRLVKQGGEWKLDDPVSAVIKQVPK